MEKIFFSTRNGNIIRFGSTLASILEIQISVQLKLRFVCVLRVYKYAVLGKLLRNHFLKKKKWTYNYICYESILLFTNKFPECIVSKV